MQFTYEAKTSTGQTISGSLEAADERTAAGQIRSQGHFVVRLRPIKGAPLAGAPMPGSQPTYNGGPGQPYGAVMTSPPLGPQAQSIPGQNEVTAYPGGYEDVYQTAGPEGLTSTPQTQAWYEPPAPTGPMTGNPFTWLWDHLFKPLFPGVTPFQLAATYRQFGALLGAGVPMHTTLDTVAAEAVAPEMRLAIERMRPTINAGGKLSDAMRTTAWIFPASHRAMTIPGEITGGLDIVFNRLADMVESEYRLRLKLQQSIVQPVLTLGGLFLLPPAYMLFIGMWKLYLMTAVLPMVLFIVFCVGCWAATRLLSQVRVVFDTFAASLPAVGKIIRMLTVARFCRMLGMLYSGGVAVPAAVHYAADACGNVYLSWMMRKVAGYVESGYQLVDSFAAVRVFPPLVISMMGTGEATGKVDVMMIKVAEYYGSEAELSMHKAVQTFSVLMTIIVGVLVLIELIHAYTGYFQQLLNTTAE